MSVTLTRAILGATLALAVTGCGGGSSGSGESTPKEEPTPQTLTVSLDHALVQASEKEVFLLSGQFTSPDTIELSQSPDIGLQFLSARNNQISLRVPDVDRPRLSEIKLTFVYGDQSFVRSVSLLAENDSASSLIKQVGNTLNEKESILELTQDAALYRFFLDYAYLYGLLTHNEKTQRLAEFSPSDSEARNATGLAIEHLSGELEAYQQGRISDQVLGQALSLAEQSIRDHGHYGSQMLREIQSLVEVLVPGLSEGELVYVAEVGIYSRMLSTPKYGEMGNAGFELAQSYQPIESLIRVRESQSLMCERL